MTGNEIRPLLRDTSVLVCFACRKGCRDKMPKTALDARFPWKKGPLMRGMVTAVTRDGKRAKVEDGAGGYGWVDLDAILIQVDEL
jgi:hypothetical protein